jgi:hypothetical protein
MPRRSQNGNADPKVCISGLMTFELQIDDNKNTECPAQSVACANLRKMRAVKRPLQ